MQTKTAVADLLLLSKMKLLLMFDETTAMMKQKTSVSAVLFVAAAGVALAGAVLELVGLPLLLCSALAVPQPLLPAWMLLRASACCFLCRQRSLHQARQARSPQSPTSTSDSRCSHVVFHCHQATNHQD